MLVGARGWNDAMRAADAYTDVLKNEPDAISLSQVTDQMQGDWLAQFRKHAAVLLTSAQEEQLRSQPPQFWLDTARAGLYGMFSGPKVGAWQDDPFGLLGGWVQERARETPVRPRDGRLAVSNADRHYVLLPMMLNVPAFSMSAQETVLPLLDHAAQAARHAVPTADIIASGVVLHTAAAGEQAAREVSLIGAGSLVGIALLTWLAFRSIKPIGLVLLSIGIGCLGALSICWILFGRIHLLTLVFGASLIGVAQDYGIYFLCHRLNADERLDSVALLRKLLPGLGLTLLAAVIGYAGLALTPFPGLRQMALFSALGLIFAWLTVVCWFPSLIAGGRLRGGVLVMKYGALLKSWPPRCAGHGKFLVAGLLLLGMLLAAGLSRLDANDDIRQLQNPPRHLVEDQMKLNKLLDAASPVQFFLVRGISTEEVLQREEALKHRLDPLIADGKISGYQAMSNWVPSVRTQEERKSLLEEKLYQPGGPLAKLARETGEDGAWVERTRDRLLKTTGVLTVDDFLKTPASEPWRHLWLGNVDGEVAGIVALRGLHVTEFGTLKQVARDLPGVQWVDKVDEISSVLGRYRQYMMLVLLGAYAVVFLVLSLRYRFAAWRVLGPVALASIATLAMLGFFGQDLQLFHVLALMLLLGVGVDYGIFMQEHPGRDSTVPWLAVGLSAANTILSFGLLALSHTPALHAFGLTMLIGILLVWITVPCFGKRRADDMQPWRQQ
ncbi:MMPL family transporter [Oxalicibacterium solurbis]|uniref:MMPL family transporter n=1 Tax=Oxalicibacterium solurbis TaxID=69280 RepID=UPI001E54612A|nr:MMPL family transporter [Oxalicibacterium solurbis]